MEELSQSKRKFLLGSTGVLGGCVAVLGATPFAASLRPSRKTKVAGAPVKLDITNIKPGEIRRTSWRKKLIWALGRDESMLSQAAEKRDNLLDPDSESSLQPEYCKNEHRSIKPEVFVAVGICTHLGCSPGESPNKEESWFICACHGSKFDVAGRVFNASPAPNNLIIPPHHYNEDGELVIGLDPA